VIKLESSSRVARRPARQIQRLLLYFAGGMTTVGGACTDGTNPDRVIDQTFSFETSFDGWAARAIDDNDGGSVALWQVSRSSARATDGEWAVELSLENYTDAAKVWLGRQFVVAPNRNYRVTIEFDLATADYGQLNLFRLIAGALPRAVGDRSDLAPVFRGETGNGQSSDVGFRWLPKAYQTVTRSGSDGRLHVLFGIWGTYETTRHYYFDAVRVRIDAL
jgi:hypothetical protein